MNKQTIELIKEKVEKVEVVGHGEVVIKIKNGYVWRILSTLDELVSK